MVLENDGRRWAEDGTPSIHDAEAFYSPHYLAITMRAGARLRVRLSKRSLADLVNMLHGTVLRATVFYF